MFKTLDKLHPSSFFHELDLSFHFPWAQCFRDWYDYLSNSRRTKKSFALQSILFHKHYHSMRWHRAINMSTSIWSCTMAVWHAHFKKVPSESLHHESTRYDLWQSHSGLKYEILAQAVIFPPWEPYGAVVFMIYHMHPWSKISSCMIIS